MGRFFVTGRLFLGCGVLALSCALSGPVVAQEPPVGELKKQMRELQKEMDGLMKRIEELEEEKKAEADRVTSVEQSVKAVQKSPSILNPSIGMSIDTTFEHNDDNDGEFRLRTVELGLAADIDPHARAYAFITGTEEAGIEIEEAAVQTTSLPFNLTAGRFFADFGRLAQFHQHELPFVNRPMSLTRMVGGESLGTGAQVNLNLGTPFFLSVTGGVFNDIGHSHAHGDEGHGHEEEAEEHADEEHEGEEHAHEEHEGEEHEGEEHAHEEHEGEEHEGEEHAHEEHEGEEHEGEEHAHEEHEDQGGTNSLKKLTYLGRVHTFFDLSETWNIEMGSSLAYTPSAETDMQGNARTLTGVDVTIRHRPLVAGLYEGFTLAGEWFSNRQTFDHEGTVKSRGGYAYAKMDLNPEVHGRWSVGLLFDSAPDLEHPSHKTSSLSPYVTWSPSEFNRLRLQYTRGWDRGGEARGESNEVFLQWTTVLGSHTHGFRERH